MTMVKFNNGQKSVVNPWFSDVFDSLINDSRLNDRFINKVPAVLSIYHKSGSEGSIFHTGKSSLQPLA